MEANKHRGLVFLILTSFFALAGATMVARAVPPSSQLSQSKAADIARDPSDLPPPVGDRPPGVVHVTLTAIEVTGVLDPSSGTTYRYWTFNGKVPGPFIRVRQGDTVVLTLNNDKNDTMVHSIDLHAVLGPGGGAVLTQVPPGQSKTFSFTATTPGLFVYHCGTPMVAQHIANGMYGLILVEPPGGLPHVDHEYYVMQGEIYTTAPKGKSGLQQFSGSNLMQENPEYFVYNGSVGALSSQFPLQANVGETVRIFLGNAGPNATASEHMIGEIFTKVYLFGSLTSTPLTGVQTVGVPPGDAAILELKAQDDWEIHHDGSRNLAHGEGAAGCSRRQGAGKHRADTCRPHARSGGSAGSQWNHSGRREGRNRSAFDGYRGFRRDRCSARRRHDGEYERRCGGPRFCRNSESSHLLFKRGDRFTQ